jgi:hypothetical protein
MVFVVLMKRRIQAQRQVKVTVKPPGENGNHENSRIDLLERISILAEWYRITV